MLSEIWLFLLAFRAICFHYGTVTICVKCPHNGDAGLNANGTAIEGVCVTGEAIRLTVPVVSMELSRWQAGMARYLQSRVRLVLRSRYYEGSYLMFVMFKNLVSCQGKVLQIP
jgi:hypothetical protein